MKYKAGDVVYSRSQGVSATILEYNTSDEAYRVQWHDKDAPMWQGREYLESITELTTHAVQSSGRKQQFESGMQRDTNEGKERFDLIEPLDQRYADRMSTRRARVMAEGAKHYGDRNWEQADSKEEYYRFLESLDRHYRKYRAGLTDEDHAACIEYNLEGAEFVKQKLMQRGEWE